MSVDFPRKLVDLLKPEPEVNWFLNLLSFTLVFWQKGGENGVCKGENSSTKAKSLVNA